MSHDSKKAIEDGVVQSPPASDDGQPPRNVSRFTRWYRSPLFNVILVGLISFTQPGIWNALNSGYPLLYLLKLGEKHGIADTSVGTGAGGQQEPYLVNGANSLTFG
jgi:hypothetical protein